MHIDAEADFDNDGHVVVAWDAVDAWFEEDERVLVHPTTGASSGGGAGEPAVVMRRLPEERRLTALVVGGDVPLGIAINDPRSFTQPERRFRIASATRDQRPDRVSKPRAPQRYLPSVASR